MVSRSFSFQTQLFLFSVLFVTKALLDLKIWFEFNTNLNFVLNHIYQNALTDLNWFEFFIFFSLAVLFLSYLIRFLHGHFGSCSMVTSWESVVFLLLVSDVIRICIFIYGSNRSGSEFPCGSGQEVRLMGVCIPFNSLINLSIVFV